MRMSSSAFADGAAIPRSLTCDGEDLSPALAWQDEPAGTRSFVLLCDDPDAPAGTWHHWAAYDIPASQHSRRRTPPGVAANSSRRATISAGPATAARARRAATPRITTISACSRSRSSGSASPLNRPAGTSNARRDGTSSPKRPL